MQEHIGAISSKAVMAVTLQKEAVLEKEALQEDISQKLRVKD